MRQRFGVLLFAAALAVPAAASGQRTVIVTRHAEKVSETDERLTEAGRARAARLAALLKDAGIAAIFSTKTERTIGTVQPLADALGRKVEIYDTGGGKGNPADSRAFVERLRKEHANDIILVAGHTNTIPDLLKTLGCPDEVAIAPDEYDNLFVVVPKGDGTATLLRLRY